MKEILTTVGKNLKQARFTYVLFAYCFLVFGLIQYFRSGDFVPDHILTYFGAPLAIEIYTFHYWGIITNSFVHYEIGNFVLNSIGILLLGSYVERRIGVWNFFLFGLVASTISSAIQLAFSDDAGVGLSGVNYALFGFAFAKTYLDSRFRIVQKNIAFFVMLFFIPFCEYMNVYEKWNVATLALIAGFVVGVLIAFLTTSRKVIAQYSLLFLLVFSAVSLVYTPWSSQWNCAKGIAWHEKGEIEKARSYYLTAISYNRGSVCGNDNLNIIKVDALSGKAFTAHNRGDYLKARFYYEEIIKIDPKNSWAINNLKRLP
jgi:GlpG protein